MTFPNLPAAALAAAQARGNRRHVNVGLTRRIRAALQLRPQTASELAVLLDARRKVVQRMANQLVSGRGFKVLRAQRDAEKVYACIAYVELPDVASHESPATSHGKLPYRAGRKDRDPNRPRCPECDCGQLKRYAKTFACEHCRHIFTHAEAVTDALLAAAAAAQRKAAPPPVVRVVAPKPYRTGYRWGASWL